MGMPGGVEGWRSIERQDSPTQPKVIHVRDQSRYEIMGHEVVLIDRTTPYGNPFYIDEVNSRPDVIEAFRKLMISRLLGPEKAKWRDRVRELRGKTLACHCAPAACHGDVWLEFAAMESWELDGLLEQVVLDAG